MIHFLKGTSNLLNVLMATLATYLALARAHWWVGLTMLGEDVLAEVSWYEHLPGSGEGRVDGSKREQIAEELMGEEDT